MARQSLTNKQQTVFEYVQQYINEHRRAPFIREIQLGCAIASYKSVVDRLNALERKGFIRRMPNKHRGIKIARRAPAVPSEPVAVSSTEVFPGGDQA
jgi:repressor LexA